MISATSPLWTPSGLRSYTSRVSHRHHARTHSVDVPSHPMHRMDNGCRSIHPSMGRMIGTRHRARETSRRWNRDRDRDRDALDHDVRAFVGHGRRCARARVTSRRTHPMGSGWVAAGASAFIVLLLRVQYTGKTSSIRGKLVVYGEMVVVVCLWFSVDRPTLCYES